MKTKFNIIIADDHVVVTKSLKIILRELYAEAVIYEYNNLKDVLITLHSKSIDLLILDITFPDGNTLNILPILKSIQFDLKILIFSGLDEDIYAVRCLNAGVNGFLTKLSTEEEIKFAVSNVMNYNKYLSKNVQEKIMNNYIFKKASNPFEDLTNRELEVLGLILNGYKNSEIASCLNLQKSTVSTHKSKIFEKLNITNIPDLIKTYSLYN